MQAALPGCTRVRSVNAGNRRPSKGGKASKKQECELTWRCEQCGTAALWAFHSTCAEAMLTFTFSSFCQLFWGGENAAVAVLKEKSEGWADECKKILEGWYTWHVIRKERMTLIKASD